MITITLVVFPGPSEVQPTVKGCEEHIPGNI